MNQGMMNTVVSAVVGGVIGACVVFFSSGSKMDLANLELENLQVANLTLTKQAVLLNEQGAPEVVIKDGSVLVEKVLLGNKVVGQQLQAHAMVANRIFATPDNLVQTPMDRWKFYAEIGASTEGGGEIVVRSVAGPASVGQATTGGSLLRMGYDPESKPQILALQNHDRSPLDINWTLSAEQKRMLNTPAAHSAGVAPFSSGAASPIPPVATPGQNPIQ